METNGANDHISETENGEGEEKTSDETEVSISEQIKATPVRSSVGLITGYRNRRISSNWTSAMSRTQTPRTKRLRTHTESPTNLVNESSPRGDNLTLEEIIDSRINAALDPARTEVSELREEVKAIKAENKRLKERCVKIDSQARKKNLKIWGIIEQNKESRFDIKKTVLQLLHDYSINVDSRDIDSVFRIGAKEEKTNRCTLVHFVHLEDKVLTQSRGRDMYRDYAVTLEDDFPPEIESNRRELKPLFLAANRSKNEAGKHKYRAALNADKLTVNGQRYTVNNTNRLPNELQPKNVSTPQKHGITAFFTKSSPLSNHYSAPQRIEGTDYSSNEQYYMEQKALCFADTTTARNVMKEHDPKIQKAMCKKFDKLDQTAWHNKRLNVMRIGLEGKFRQNEQLKDFLLATDNTNILECNRADPFWGIGMGLNNPQIWIRNSWTGKAKNQLGLLLMDLRTELRRH